MLVDAYEDCFDRHVYPLFDPRKELFDYVAGLPLPQRPRFALLRFIAFAQLEFGNRHRAILAIAIGLIVARETAAQDRQRSLDDGAMFATSLVMEGFGYSVHAFGCVLDAINQIVRILALETLVEREGLQAGEADKAGMLDLLGSDAVATQQLGLDFGDLVQVEDDGRMRDVQG
ncbi:hypothetical protein D9M69_465230 [compost metagenome]